MERLDKTEQIIDAAIKRFAHFGVQKTTLTEIAEDLGMTKQALAYYFHDKQQLACAVEEKIVGEFFQMIDQHIAAGVTVEQVLMELPEVKKTFFDKYTMLMQRAAVDAVINYSQVAESRKKVEERLVKLIAGVLEQGVAKGELKPMNTEEVSALLYDTMTAYEHCFVSRQAVPDPQTFADMCTRQKAVLQLIINGLKHK